MGPGSSFRSLLSIRPMKHQTYVFSLLLAAATLAGVSAFAGTLTVSSGPVFDPPDAFTNNNVQLEVISNPPGATGDVLHFSGSTTVVPIPGGMAALKADGTYTGVSGDNFSPIYSFTINSTSSIPISFQTFTTVVVEPIGIPMGTSSPPVDVLPGLHQYRLEPPVLPIGSLHGTYEVSLVFTFGSSAAPITADTGTLDVSLQRLDFQLAPELPTLAPQFRLLNISTRASVGTGDNALIGGFIITGADPKRILIRAIGPSLTEINVSGALVDPILEFHEADGNVITNDNWRDTQEQEIMDTGIPPTDDLESAIVATVDSGAYTAIVRGVNDTTGVALVEVYDLDDQPAVSQLANISSRGDVLTGDGVLIGGVISGSDDYDPSPIIVRAIGPSLTDLGVAGALEDPVLAFYDANGDVIASNDNWMDGLDAQTISDDGLAPSNDKESALLAIPTPGSYTAIVRGQDDSVGVALVEVYNVQ
jgi:hypothetical protein